MIGEIRQNFTEASASVGLILATALQTVSLDAGIKLVSQVNFVNISKATI